MPMLQNCRGVLDFGGHRSMLRVVCIGIHRVMLVSFELLIMVGDIGHCRGGVVLCIRTWVSAGVVL